MQLKPQNSQEQETDSRAGNRQLEALNLIITHISMVLS
jgi:hypothetical protein